MPTDTNPDPTHPIPHSPTYFEQLFASLQARALTRGYSLDPADREDEAEDDDEWDENEDPLTPPPPTMPVSTNQFPSFPSSPTSVNSAPSPRTSTPVSAEQTPSSPSSPSFPSPVNPSHRATPEIAKRTPSPPTSPNSAPTWIGTTHARRLLDVGCEKTVIGWVRYGYLRARVLPNRRTQVLLEDVLRLAQQLSQVPTTPPSQL